MNKKYDKIKSSKHHQDNLNQNRGGHGITLTEAEMIIETAAAQATQQDGRERYWGHMGQDLYRVIVSATVSAGNSIGRLVTVHRDRINKIGKPD